MIEELQIFANYGVLGIITAWFMFRMEKVINNNTKVLEGVVLAISNCPRKRKV